MTTEQLGARPQRRARPEDLADWQARTFAGLGRYASPPPADVSLDAEVVEDLFADPDATRAHLAALRRDGVL